MTKVVFVGEMYNADLSIGGGPMPGGPGYVPGLRPDNSLPGGQGGYPSHPIYYPPGIWGPTDPRPSHPIAPGGGGPVDPSYGVPIGGYPSHPIYNPAYPDNSLPGSQPGIWGPNDPRPSPPIYIPPQMPPIDPADPTKAYVVAYVPNTSTGKVERITFTVDIPEPVPPTEATPKA